MWHRNMFSSLELCNSDREYEIVMDGKCVSPLASIVIFLRKSTITFREP